MLGNYLKYTLRELNRHRLVAGINIAGLAIGLAACLLMYSYIRHELGFDGLHEKSGNIYRLNEVQSFTGTAPQHVALSMYPMGPTLLQTYPQIENFVRLISQTDVPFTVGDRLHYVPQLYLVDTSFFEIFDFPLKYGTAATALSTPNSVVISEATAIAMFGGDNALGRQFRFGGGGGTDLIVTGVLENVTSQSHIQFDALVSLPTMGTEYDNRNSRNWGGNWLNTYLLLQQGTDVAALEAQFPEFVTANIGEGATEFYELYLQPLSSLHLDSMHIMHDYQNLNKSDRSYIYIFGVLAVFVLLIATINFMNLSMARLSSRIREVGVRKTVGATQRQVVLQFLTESTGFAVLGVALSLLLAWLALPVLNAIINRDIRIDLFNDPGLTLAVLAMTLTTGVFAGVYPAVMASSFSPVRALKNEALTAHRKLSVQNLLMTLQFSVAVGMIVATILVIQQLAFIQNRDIGLNNERVLLLPTDNQLRNNFYPLKQELLAIPGVINVTASSQRLGNNLHQAGFQAQGDGPVVQLGPSNIRVDADYIDFHEMEILEGRDFSRGNPDDAGREFIINEAMLRFLEWNDIRGKQIGRSGAEEMGEVIGLVRDFNFNSLHHEVQPLIMAATTNGFSEISVKLSPATFTETIAQVERVWSESGTTLPFSYELLEQHYASLYSGDRQAGFIVTGISLLTIVIAAIGLFGMTSLSLEKRTREIGMRKVLGANVRDILLLLNRAFAWRALGAIAIATPVVWYFINRWLGNFAYHIDISAWAFVAGSLAAAGIAVLTISARVVHTTRHNPVDAIRCE